MTTRQYGRTYVRYHPMKNAAPSSHSGIKYGVVITAFIELIVLLSLPLNSGFLPLRMRVKCSAENFTRACGQRRTTAATKPLRKPRLVWCCSCLN